MVVKVKDPTVIRLGDLMLRERSTSLSKESRVSLKGQMRVPSYCEMHHISLPMCYNVGFAIHCRNSPRLGILARPCRSPKRHTSPRPLLSLYPPPESVVISLSTTITLCSTSRPSAPLVLFTPVLLARKFRFPSFQGCLAPRFHATLLRPMRQQRRFGLASVRRVCLYFSGAVALYLFYSVCIYSNTLV